MGLDTGTSRNKDCACKSEGGALVKEIIVRAKHLEGAPELSGARFSKEKQTSGLRARLEEL